MKFVHKFFIAVIALSMAAVVGGMFYDLKPADVPTPYKQITAEQRYSHLITMLSKDGEDVARCTATAIGPHAILTALHCNPRVSFGTIMLDLSPYEYTVIAFSTDGHEHLIMLLDGPAFTYYAKVNTAVPVPGEKVEFFGFPKADYPSHHLVGKALSCDNEDYSDLDRDMKASCFDIYAIEGDSGSAVWDTKHRIVSVLSYSDPDDNHAIGFPLFFSQQAYDMAYTFDPSKKE